MTDNVTDIDRQAGRWVTIAEAATILGKSTRTVRRYVAQDKLEADKSESPMLVNVTDMTDKVTGAGGQVADRWRSEVDRLRGEIEDLERKVDRLATENAALDARNELLERLLDQVGEERDYLRQANAAALSKIPDQKPGLWQRLLPWGKESED